MGMEASLGSAHDSRTTNSMPRVKVKKYHMCRSLGVWSSAGVSLVIGALLVEKMLRSAMDGAYARSKSAGVAHHLGESQCARNSL